jgi:helix-turn-helix protein
MLAFLLRTLPSKEKLPLQQELFPNKLCHLEFQMTNVLANIKRPMLHADMKHSPEFFHLHNL